MIRRFAALAAFGAALVVTGLGCGSGLNTADIKVTLDGTPVPGATVSIANESGKSAVGLTDANGIAKLAMVGAKAGKMGVDAGTYTVSIQKTEVSDYGTPTGPNNTPGEMMKKHQEEIMKKSKGGGIGSLGNPAAGKPKQLLPEKYADPKTSGFTLNVPADTSRVKEFALVSK